MFEEADREAAAYVQTAMSFVASPPRLTVIAPPAIPAAEELPPATEPAVTPVDGPAVTMGASTDTSTGTSTATGRGGSFPLLLVLCVLMFGLLVTHRRRRRSWHHA